MNKFALLALLTFAGNLAAAPREKSAPNEKKPAEETAQLEQMTARFAPTELTADLTKLSAGDRRVLARLIEASKVIDAIFLRQVWTGNDAMLLDLAGDLTAEGRARLHYFQLNKGPWSALDGDKPFVRGAPAKPANAGFYPDDATKPEVEQWIGSLPEEEGKLARGFFSVIRHDADGRGFRIVPYNMEYQSDLLHAAALLREAADAASEPTLKNFLSARAEAFLTNDYYASDVAWMELKGAIEPTIGPYEVYEDGWFNYKAALESFIAVQDEAETAKLQKFSGELQDIENHLPIDPKYRNPKLGALAPITVVNEIFCAGDGNHGVQTAAFNLPNDERVVAAKGTKRVMLKNVQDAKFAKTLVPISKVVLSAADQKDLSFDAFFTHILVHELMHGLGPHNITVDGRATTVRQEMKEAGSALEEAKADIASLFAIQYMIDKGVLPKSLERPLYTTYMTSAFRTIRFGINEAHGKGQAMQLNYLLDAGGFVVRPDGTFAVEPAKIKQGVTSLTHEFMTMQAEGRYDRAKEMQARLGIIRPEVQRALDKMGKIPIDIEPRFPTAEALLDAEKP
ncbi:MAG: dipeptidyl-peptidase 3 family protein [Chthoniobacterales bacterium]